MPGAVYHPFTPNDKFETKVATWPSIIWWSASDGYHSNLGFPSGTLSLYGGIRSRTDVGPFSSGSVRVYPIDEVDTHSIDKVIGISGSYPATGTISLVHCTNDSLSVVKNLYPTASNTQTRWYDNYYRPIEILHDWHSRYHPAYSVFVTSTYPSVRLLHIPEMFYDKQIVTGTVKLTDWTHANSGSSPYDFVDDGRGALVLSGTRQQWGTVFYCEGLIVMLPPSGSGSWILGGGVGDLSASYGGRQVQLEFSGSHTIVTKTFMCRIHENECNCSRNPTWSVTGTAQDGSLQRIRSGSDNTTYITSIGLYNEDYELVAVAKIAQPIRNREHDRLDIRLRMDF
jgi:hypothetical protein